MNTLFLEHFDDLLVTSENAEQLNRAILDLAVHGKLTRQEPNDEPAKELLKRLYFEKDDLSLTTKEEEKPFDLPQGWEWVKLKGLGQTQTGATPPTSNPDFFGKDYAFIKPADISDNAVNYSNEGLSKLGIEKGRLVKAKSILMVCIGGSIGKVGYVDRDCSCNQQINVLTPSDHLVHKVIYYFLKSPYFQNEVLSRAPKTTLPILSKGKWEMILIPVPPFAEQQRIVSRVEELFAQTRALAKELAHSQNELAGLNKSALSHLLASETPNEFNQHWEFIAEHFDPLFQTPEHVTPLRQSILELAVRGKLTQRESRDEPARELLKRIKAEKSENEKPLPAIKDSDKSFDLPEGWEWCLAGDLLTFVTSGSRGWAKYYSTEGAVYLRIGNLDYESIDLDLRNIQRVRPPQTVERERIRVQPGDILISMTGDVGMTAVVKDGELDEAYVNQHIGINRPSKEIFPAFLAYVVISRHGLSQLFKSRKGIKNSLALDDMKFVVVALPPLAEQERIVKRVEQLLSLCDALEARLQSAEEERGRLVASVMAGVGAS